MQTLLQNRRIEPNAMRYAPTHKEEARSRLVQATGALAKQKGFAASGVDSLMAAAGLTSGAFYAHFRSKNELLKAIVENELQRSAKRFAAPTREQALEVLRRYLSAAHVEHPGSGCALPALASEIARADAATRQVFAQGIGELQARLRDLTGDDATAWALMAQLAGAVLVARALPPGPEREALLASALQQAERMLGAAPGPS